MLVTDDDILGALKDYTDALEILRDDRSLKEIFNAAAGIGKRDRGGMSLKEAFNQAAGGRTEGMGRLGNTFTRNDVRAEEPDYSYDPIAEKNYNKPVALIGGGVSMRKRFAAFDRAAAARAAEDAVIVEPPAETPVETPAEIPAAIVAQNNTPVEDRFARYRNL